MQQVADWLKKLGLGQYAQCFADNGIDLSVLPHLTDQDLKDIGVLLGHRRKMLAPRNSPIACPRPSFLSQSATCCIGPHPPALASVSD
jgi:hypothetical protein